MPRVSLIIPTYNRADYLALALNSARAQTYADMEIIVCDNASTDDTPQLVEKAMSQEPRMRYIRRPVNEGAIANFNKGFDESKGDYIFFLGDDDALRPQAIQRLVQLLDARPDVDIACARWLIIDEQGHRIETIGPLPEGNFLREFAVGYPLWVGAMLFRRTVWIAYEGYQGHVGMSDDWDLMLRMMVGGCRIGAVQELLVERRIHTRNISSDVPRVLDSGLKVLKGFYARSDLPADVAALKPKSYAALYIWTSLRFYSSLNETEGQHHFRQWLNLQPAGEDVATAFLQHVRNELWNARTVDAESFVKCLFDHLPNEVAGLRSHQTELECEAIWRAVLMRYAHDGVETGKQNLSDRIAQNAVLLAHPDRFCESLVRVAHATSDAPLEFAERVLANLPPNARALARVTPEVLGSLRLVRAFAHYASHRWSNVPHEIFSAVRMQPGLLRNRGVWSIFARSMLANVTGASAR